jgi:hypothetical protein
MDSQGAQSHAAAGLRSQQLIFQQNAFSKKVENHAYQVVLHFMHYNFCRIHTTLRCTPAMEACVSEHVWSIEEIVRLLRDLKSGPRGPYKKRNAEC